ncbi:MAG: histone deacetylase [Deltaproteobacteria bacterium]|nr:histone deacetylase [Deltaproteobacteria bacterium]
MPLGPATWTRALRPFRGRRLRVWYHPTYRIPLTSLEPRAGMEPRRSDLAAWYLEDTGAVSRASFCAPGRVAYRDLARVHTPGWLESLSDAKVLARVYGVDPWDVPVDELLATVRHACGATVEATQEALTGRRFQLNLLGGFHHAAPDRGSGLCAVNDVAVAIAVARAEGFEGRVVVLDLDAHPPDGLAACLNEDPAAWIGSLSGSDWGPVPGADETILPVRCGDGLYMEALSKLLARMPKPDLAFVIAGGDVLHDDRMGRLGLTLEGVRQRDRRVARALATTPQVWLAGGGYSPDAWRALAGTGLVLAGQGHRPVQADADPLRWHFSRIAQRIDVKRLGGEDFLSTAELEEALGVRRPESRRLLGFYTDEGLEYSLETYGLLPQVRRLGYGDLRVRVDRASSGDRLRLFGRADGAEHVLVEAVLAREEVEGRPMLFVHWLTLRNPRVPFTALRPRLPGQEVPGLGLAREAGEMLLRIARRLDLEGVAVRPAHFHVAYAARYRLRMVDPILQGRFEAILRDLGHLPLHALTSAIAEGRVLLDGRPWAWEPGLMAYRFEEPPSAHAPADRERDRARFRLA